jgi:protein-disulfide isomerase
MPIRPARVASFVSAAVLAGLIGCGVTFSTTTRAAEAPALDKAAIEAIVKDYILEHPEVIEQAQTILENRHAAEAEVAQKKALATVAPVLFDSPNQVVLGNPKGDVTLVEFFDYNCGYCKQALPDMINLIAGDKNLRVVLKEFPILTAGSVEAARIAVAVNHVAPERYLEFHQKLLGGRGAANKQRALEVVAEMGLDKSKIDAESQRQDLVMPPLKESTDLASRLGLNGTPSYVIGQTIIPGAVGMDRLKDKIADMRQTCKADGGVKAC